MPSFRFKGAAEIVAECPQSHGAGSEERNDLMNNICGAYAGSAEMPVILSSPL